MSNSAKDRLRNRGKAANEAFDEKYKSEIARLSGLSAEQLSSLQPEGSDPDEFNQVMAAVRNASTNNLNKAQLKSNIQNLGGTALSLAKKITPLGALLG